MTDTMARATVAIGDSRFLLAQGQDFDDLRHRMEVALRMGGGFVDFVAVGNRLVTALITGREFVVFTVETVAYDERDTGDIENPFNGFSDAF